PAGPLSGRRSFSRRRYFLLRRLSPLPGAALRLVDQVDCILRSLLCNRESVGDGASVLLAALSSAVDGDLIIAGFEFLAASNFTQRRRKSRILKPRI
ncbi:hypothetical protein LINPERHAP2_LOCUS20909, partial [Linum perenne]